MYKVIAMVIYASGLEKNHFFILALIAVFFANTDFSKILRATIL